MLGERLSGTSPSAACVVLLGVAASQGRLRRRRAAAEHRARVTRPGTMRPVRAVMSIQSSVVYGHVGSTAATLPLQRLGFDVWALPTVVYSSHAGYPGVRGGGTPISTLRELLAGLEALGRLDRCEAVLSGYLGRPEAWRFVLEALDAVRAHRPDAWYVCDPVLGDEGELYVPAELVRTFREQAVPRADLLVPNRFELEWLVDRPVGDASREAVAAARELHEAGAREVVVKGLVLEHDGSPMQHVVGLDADGAWLARAPHIAQFWSGRRRCLHGAPDRACGSPGVPLGDAVGARDGADAGADRAHARARGARAAPRRDRLGSAAATAQAERLRLTRRPEVQPASSRAATSGATLPPESTSTVPAAGSTAPAEQRGDRRGRCGLAGELGARVEEAEPLRDLLLADGHDLVEQLASAPPAAGRRSSGGASASASVAARGRSTGSPAAIEAASVAIAAGSTPITRASGASALTAVATPRDQPAAADRHDDLRDARRPARRSRCRACPGPPSRPGR